VCRLLRDAQIMLVVKIVKAPSKWGRVAWDQAGRIGTLVGPRADRSFDGVNVFVFITSIESYYSIRLG